jgi:6-phosphogluconolactonase
MRLTPILAAAGVAASLLSSPMPASSCWVYFGTSATDASRGIYCSRLDQDTGALSPAQKVADTSNSVFFAFSPDKTYLYGLSEVPGKDGHSHEAINTFRVDAATGSLTLISQQVSEATEGCHINVDPAGRFVLTANYNYGFAEVFPIQADHTVGPRCEKVVFAGSGPDKSRQLSAHAHSVNFDPSGRYAIIADLGQDRLFVYALDPKTGALTAHSAAVLAPGAGPRHFAFHPDGKHAFVINEMAATITVLSWDAEKGVLTPGMSAELLPRDYAGPLNTASEVVVSQDGRFVYGANRGEDTLVVNAFDPATGKLTFVQKIHDGIQVPRNYAIDPTGRWLVCGNLTANTVGVYAVDKSSGTLALKGHIAVPQPLCVRYLAIPE